MATTIAAVLINASVAISLSGTRNGIRTHLIQSLRGDADRIVNLIRLDMAEADAVFASNGTDAECTKAGGDTVVFKIRHPFLAASTRARTFSFICYLENTNGGLFRSGAPYSVPSAEMISSTSFNGSNYLGSGYLDTAATVQRQLVRPQTTLRPNAVNPTIGPGFDSLLFGIQLSTQNLVSGSVWNKSYLVSDIRVSVAGRCVAPGATASSSNQTTTTC